VAHWEDIQELDALTLNVVCHQPENIIFARQFITMILKKVRKIRLLNYQMSGPQLAGDEPFFVEEVPHLYESLEKFEHSLWDWGSQRSAKFDLKIMKLFRNLKELKLGGSSVTYENVEEVVSLMEENQREGDKIPTLEIKINSMLDQDWLGETFRSIEKIRREDKALEMLIDLGFKDEDLFDLLERLCQGIQAVKAIKGLVISLTLENNGDVSALTIEKLREVLNKSGEVHNLKIVLYNASGLLTYSKLEGEKEQFCLHHFEI